MCQTPPEHKMFVIYRMLKQALNYQTSPEISMLYGSQFFDVIELSHFWRMNAWKNANQAVCQGG